MAELPRIYDDREIGYRVRSDGRIGVTVTVQAPDFDTQQLKIITSTTCWLDPAIKPGGFQAALGRMFVEMHRTIQPLPAEVVKEVHQRRRLDTPDPLSERITHSAVVYGGQIFISRRHHNVINVVGKTIEETKRHNKQEGFWTSAERYLDRPTAAILAQVNGQLRRPLITPPDLYSEDLWI